jgi:hypothetical protein
VALPAVHWKVTLDEANVDPGDGLTITAGPGLGVGVAVGVGVADGLGVGIGPPAPTIKIPLPVALCPSGFVIVTFCELFDAAVVFKSNVTCVGST